jgi:sulfonate transport system ATP-binding protein
MSLAEAASPRRAAADAPAASLKLRTIVKAFGDKKVLRGLDLDIAAGQFVAVIGRSGCGKSTLLRLIAGLDAPDAGAIDFDGGADVVPRVMFQEPRLLPWANVIANVEIGLGARRREAGARRRALDALAAVGLADRAADWPGTCRAARSSASPWRGRWSADRVLALDEPLGALDALTRIEMQSLLETAWRREGFTALLVTHDVAEAATLADRIVLLEDGAVALDLEVALPRPRLRGSPEFGRLEETILDRLLGRREAPSASERGATSSDAVAL